MKHVVEETTLIKYNEEVSRLVKEMGDLMPSFCYPKMEAPLTIEGLFTLAEKWNSYSKIAFHLSEKLSSLGLFDVSGKYESLGIEFSDFCSYLDNEAKDLLDPLLKHDEYVEIWNCLILDEENAVRLIFSNKGTFLYDAECNELYDEYGEFAYDESSLINEGYYKSLNESPLTLPLSYDFPKKILGWVLPKIIHTMGAFARKKGKRLIVEECTKDGGTITI